MTPTKIPTDEGHAQGEDDSSFEADDAALKTEVVASPKADFTGGFPVERVLHEWTYRAEDGYSAAPDHPMKTEVRILSSSKKVVPAGELKPIAAAVFVALKYR